MASTTFTALDSLRVSPGAHLTADMQRASASAPGDFTIREIAFARQAGLRAQPGSDSAAALERALGLALPAAVGEVSGDAQGLHVIWLSPDEFLAVDPSTRQRPGDTVALEAALAGLPGQAVDLSANRTIVELRGSRIREVLEKGCRADVHPRAFPVGTAIATQLGPVALILHRSGEESYRLYPRASFADYTVRWVLDAALEFTEVAR